MARVVTGVRGYFVRRASEWWLCAVISVFGAILLAPGELFVTSRGFAVMANYASELTWGLTLCCIGAARITALTLNGTFHRFRRFSPYVRAAAAAVSGLVWLSVAAGVALASGLTTGVGTYTLLAVAELFILFVVAEEAGVAEKAYRNGPTTTFIT